MSAPPEGAAPPQRPDGAVVLRRTRDRRAARLLALVLHARRLPYRVEHEGPDWLVLSTPDAAAAAEDELTAYERENRGWPPRSEPFDPLADGTVAVAGYAVVIAGLYALDHHAGGGLELAGHGRALAGAIREGQWWRALTALTLHVDLVHVTSNLVFGSLFLAQIAQVLGTGLALSSFVLAGALGNLANAWIQPADHASVGASTAVFGAIGILAAHRWQRRARSARESLRSFGPLVVALFFLGYLGTGGENTDVMAHVTGLAAGIGIGALLGRVAPDLASGRWSILVTVSGPLALALAWTLAYL